MKTSRKSISILLTVSVVLIGTLFLAEAKADTDVQYTLSLAATPRFSTVTLTAHLTSIEKHKEKNVVGAIIYFYTCNSYGKDLRKIGQNVTKPDGTTTWHWSATKNGDYWFKAAYVINTDEQAFKVTS